MRKIDIKGYTLKEIQEMDLSRTIKLTAIRNTVEYLWYNETLMAYNRNVLPALEQAADREGLLFDLAGTIVSVKELDHAEAHSKRIKDTLDVTACPTCGALIDEYTDTCPVCGSPLEEPSIDNTTCDGCKHFTDECECEANDTILNLEKKIEELERIIDMKDTIISNLYNDVTDLDEKAHRLTQTVDMLKAHVDVYSNMIDICRKFNIPV